MRRTLVAVAALGLMITGCESSGAASGRYTSADVEYKLAAIAGETLTESNIARYDTALDQAQLACRESRTQIGDMVYTASQQATGSGNHLSMLDILHGIAESVPEGMRPTPCSAIIAGLVTLS